MNERAQQAVELHAVGKTWNEIAPLIGMHHGDSVRKLVREARKKGELGEVPGDFQPEPLSPAAVDLHQRDQNRADAWQINNAARWELLVRKIEEAAVRAPRLPQPRIARPRNTHLDAGVEFSDTQIGQKTRLEDMGGLGEYSTAIFETRLWRLRDHLLEKGEFYKPERLYHFFLGDIVDGSTIYPSQAWALEMGVAEQLIYAADILPGYLISLLEVYPEIIIPAVGGNHGRVGKGGKSAEFLFRENMDRVLYHHVAAKTAAYPQIKWEIPKTWWNWTEIRGKGYLQVHGDDIPNLQGLLERAAMRYHTLYVASGRVPRIDYVLHGHHHSFLMGDMRGAEAVSNGSFPGISELSAKKLQVVSKPSQNFFTIDETGTIDARYKLALT